VTLEPTGDELVHDEAPLPAEIGDLLEPGPHSLSQKAFFRSLRAEIARATRYNFLVCVIVLRILPNTQSPFQPESEGASELTRLLDSTLRTTDTLGCLGRRLVGVIIPHSSENSATRLFERLQAESLFSAFRRRTGCDLRAAFSLYPTDAVSISGLVRVACQRLCA